MISPRTSCAQSVIRHLTAALFSYLFAGLVNTTCHADTLQDIELRLNPGRAAHSFSIQVEGGSNGAGIVSKSFVESVNPANSYSSLSLNIDTEQAFTLFDDTAGHFIFFGSTGLSGTVSSDAWNFKDAPPRQYLLVSQERSDHTFLLRQSPGTFTLAIAGPMLELGGGGSGSSLIRREISALYTPGANFWLIDLNTNERSANNLANTAISAWSANTEPLPVVPVTLYLGMGEDGQTFTLHSRFPGGPEQMQSVSASALYPAPGSWSIGYVDENGTIFTQDHAGNELVVASGTCAVTGAVGLGMQFWLTRDADGAGGPVMSIDGFGNGQWAYGSFPELPSTSTLEWITFRIPRGSSYFVGHEDGYVAQLQVIFSGILYSYDDYGNVDNMVEYDDAIAQVDTSQIWWAANDGGQVADPYVTDLLNWHPTHADPPPVNADSVAITIPLVGWSNVQFVQEGTSNVFPPDFQEVQIWNGYTWVTVSYPGKEWWTYEAVDGNGQWLYSIPCLTAYVACDRNKSFWITAEYGGNTYSSTANVTDLHAWFPSPDSVSLTISSSRWGHDLRLCHPNGDVFTIQQNATQGDFSFDPNQQGWFNSYYYFDAIASRYGFLNWWVEDHSVLDDDGLPERSPINPSSADLINWIALPIPEMLSGALTASRAVELRWARGVASSDGAFLIERMLDNGGTWQVIGTVAASNADSGGALIFTDSALQVGHTHSYRTRYTFGGRFSSRSNVVQIAGWLDTDNDGIPDWLDPDGDNDDDGIPNGMEIGSGRDPTRKDNPAVQLSVSGFVVP